MIGKVFDRNQLKTVNHWSIMHAWVWRPLPISVMKKPKTENLAQGAHHFEELMEHSSEPNFSVLLVSSLEISDIGAYISITSSRGLTRPAGPVLVMDPS